jgi:hypothetical protein
VSGGSGSEMALNPTSRLPTQIAKRPKKQTRAYDKSSCVA